MHRDTWIVACCCLIVTTWVCAADVVIDQHQPVILSAPDPDRQSLVLDLFINDRWQQLDLSLDADLTQRSRAGGSPDSAHYQGRVRGDTHSWVRLSWVDHAWQGGIFIGGELMMLERRQRVSQLLSQPDRSHSRHLLFNVRDVRFITLIDPGGEHDSEHVGGHGDGHGSGFNGGELIGELQGDLPDPDLEVPLTMVVDSQFLDRYGSTATTEALARLNLLNGIFRQQLGTGFHLLNLNLVSDNANMVDPHPANLLHEFRDYMRTGPGSGIERIGVVNLLSGRDMTGGFVGSAWQGAVCQEHNHFSVNEDFGGMTLSTLIMAHELGHNLNAPHDGTGACSDEAFDGIMNAQINGTDQFSDCSISEMELELATATCLIDTSETLFRSDFEFF